MTVGSLSLVRRDSLHCSCPGPDYNAFDLRRFVSRLFEPPAQMSIQPASQALFRNDDLRDAIFAHCDKTTLLALVRVDRMCFGVAVRYIWRVVRVSMLEYAWTAGVSVF